MFDFMSFKKQVGSIKAQVDGLNGAIEGKKKELHHLRRSMPPKADFIAHFDSVSDLQAATYDDTLKFAIERLAGDPLNLDKTDGIGVLTAALPGVVASPKTMQAALLALLGDEIKKSLRKRIEVLPWPKDVGPPVAERPALIKKVECELAALEKDLAELHNQVAQAGIVI